MIWGVGGWRSLRYVYPWLLFGKLIVCLSVFIHWIESSFIVLFEYWIDPLGLLNDWFDCVPSICTVSGWCDHFYFQWLASRCRSCYRKWSWSKHLQHEISSALHAVMLRWDEWQMQGLIVCCNEFVHLIKRPRRHSEPLDRGTTELLHHSILTQTYRSIV